MRFILAMMLLVFGLSAASASPSCMTLHEARHAHPNVHLWWHPGEDGRCWDNTHGDRHASRHRKIQSSGGGVEKHGDFSQTRSESPGAQDRIAGVAPSPPETAWPRVVHITMAVTMFNERWPEPTVSPISPLRWSHELIEFGGPGDKDRGAIRPGAP